jgi:hypothetical protein
VEATPAEAAAPGTPIQWEDEGSEALLTETPTESTGVAGISTVMVPLSLGLISLVFFFRKRVFNHLPGTSTEEPLTVVARKATGNQSAIFLIDVEDLEGGTRRLLVGCSPNGNSLLADVSPSHAIFPEPVFEDAPAVSPENHAPTTRTDKGQSPVLRAVENCGKAARSLLDFGPKRALIDELISSSEKSSYRPRSMKKAYSDATPVSYDPNPEEKRRTAQTVLDEVLAERQSGHQGTKVRVTA